MKISAVLREDSMYSIFNRDKRRGVRSTAVEAPPPIPRRTRGNSFGARGEKGIGHVAKN